MASLQHLHWKQGLFLKPQHFQQLSQSIGDTAYNHACVQSGAGVGVYQIELDKQALKSNVFKLVRCVVVMADGALLDYPVNCQIAPLNLKRDDASGATEVTVFLSITPLSGEGDNVSDSAQKHGRFVIDDSREVNDLCDSEDSVIVEQLTYNARLLMSYESATHPAEQQGSLKLPIARLVLVGEQYEIDSKFIPPIHFIAASECLQMHVKSMRESLLARYEQLESFNGLYSVDGGGASLRIMLALQVITESIPYFVHFDEVPATRVSDIYLAFRCLIAKLSNFSKLSTVTGECNDTSLSLPAFQLDNLSHCFATAVKLSQQLLNQLTVSPELLVEMQLQESQCFVASLSHQMVAEADQYYLRLRSEMNLEEQVHNIIDFAKLGADSQVMTYLTRALPGVKLEYSARKPLGVANKPNSYYFTVGVNCFEWDQVIESQRIGFSWSEKPDDLSVELIAVRR